MTTIEQPAATTEVTSAPRPRRSRGRRLSSGHLIMIVAGLVAVVANYAVLRARDDSVRVAVTAAGMEAGELLDADDLAFTEVRADRDVLAGLVLPDDVPALEGSVVTAALPTGELLRRADLQAPSAPSAQRAMSIPIEPEHAVSGALAVGDRVDVIEVDGRTATYLVTDAEVLAVPPAEPAGIAGGLRGFSVTVAVDDATALRVAVAIRSGQLELVRSTGSAEATSTRVDMTALPGPAGPGTSGPSAAPGAVLEPAASHGGASEGGAPGRGEVIHGG